MRKGWMFWIIIGLGIGGYYYHYFRSGTGLRPGSEKMARQFIPPVRVVRALRGDVGLYRDALGTVTPANSVVVRPRVEGLLQAVLFRDGEYVKKGAPLAEIDPRPYQVQLAQFEAQFSRDAVMLENAQADLARYRDLEKKDAVARQQLDTQANLVRQYQANLKVTQAQIENARLLLSYCSITAPVSGKIGLRRLDAGNLVKNSDANGLAVINQIQPIAVLFSLVEDDLPKIIKAQRDFGELLVEAWDRTANKLLARGVLASMENQIDVTTGTIKLKAQFENRGEELFPNQFVKVRLRLETRRASTIIPGAAVQYGVNGNMVYVINADNTVAVRAVNLGPSEGEQIIVEKGIDPDEQVVIDGIDKLRAGMRVEIAGD